MQSLWSDETANDAIERYAPRGVNEDLALRVYTTRLLGGDPELVLHGGGNTSVKTRVRDLNDRETEVLCVKGSGWDMASIEPPGLPAVRLDALKALEARDALSDEDMVALQRQNLVDPASPNPSIETLLHAFLPHKFIDHTHSNAIVTLTDQPDGEKICADLFADRAAVVPWVIPGFRLAKVCAEVHRANPSIQGLILSMHGIFTFAETAREAYELMIDMVTMAEQRLEAGARPFAQVSLPASPAPVADVAPIIRGAISAHDAQGGVQRFVLEHRTSDRIRHYVDGRDLADYGRRGPITPDHVLRTKRLPLVVPAPEAGHLDAFKAQVHEAVEDYVQDYRAYFEENNARHDGTKKPLDPMPRVVLVPGIGVFAAGKSKKDAMAAADLAEATADVVAQAEAFGRFTPLDAKELFDIEYWSLEQAKLSKATENPLQRHVVAITGGAGAIGRATAQAFAAEGCEVALIDLPGDRLDEAAEDLGALAAPADLTEDAAVAQAFDRVAETYGGFDILVSNAGAAWQGTIGDVDETVMRQSFELNFWAHQRAAQAAVRIMRAQGTGGALVFNVTKQAVNPGHDFGPYGIPKAATLALMRQYALDHGADGITSNAVNADRIRSGLLTDEMIASRSKARGLSEADYMGGNLLHREVRASDVAQAFVQLAKARATTGAVLTVDGGNVAAMMR